MSAMGIVIAAAIKSFEAGHFWNFSNENLTELIVTLMSSREQPDHCTRYPRSSK
jgi:hypothetical protein